MLNEQICTTCQTGANSVKEYPIICPFIGMLKDNKCNCYYELEILLVS